MHLLLTKDVIHKPEKIHNIIIIIRFQFKIARTIHIVTKRLTCRICACYYSISELGTYKYFGTKHLKFVM